MKQKFIKIISVSLIITFMFSNITFAASEKGKGMSSVTEVSQLLPPDQKSSISTPQPGTRGEALAISTLDISNEGGGKIGIVAMTLLHRDVDWGMVTIYLDRWSEENQTWEFLAGYETEFPEGNNHGETTSLDVSLLVTDQPSGYYYRLRGAHEVEYTNDKGKTIWEGHVTRTNGVMITDTP